IHLWNIILWEFMGAHFSLVCVVGFLYTCHSTGLKEVTFFDQFVNAFRVRLLRSRQTLQISGLTSRCQPSSGALLSLDFSLDVPFGGYRCSSLTVATRF